MKIFADTLLFCSILTTTRLLPATAQSDGTNVVRISMVQNVARALKMLRSNVLAIQHLLFSL